MKVININSNSFKVFNIEMFFNEIKLSSGTAFFGGNEDEYMLFTNRHNVTGKNNETDEYLSKTAAIPNKIKILIPLLQKEGDSHQGSGASQYFTIPLYYEDSMTHHVWVEHPKSNKIDVVGIRFNPKEISVKGLIFSIDKDWHEHEVADLVNVIGYPYGLSVENFPIWVTGYIASEPNIDYKGLPLFLIDCRTRQGQSGSPVIKRFRIGDSVKHKDSIYTAKEEQTHLLGIYSGRINNDSDIGRVWKTTTLVDIIEKSKEIFGEKYSSLK